MDENQQWRRCNTCKKPIAFKAKYWVCNVSTCNRKRTGLVFCDVSCWDAHLPMMNHRESWAEERKAPTADEWAQLQAAENEPKKRQMTKRSSKESQVEETKPASAPGPTVVLRRRKEGE